MIALVTQMALHLDAPINIGRDEARELAQRELANEVYHDAEPSWWERASNWAWEHFNELLNKATGALGGTGWLLVLVVVVIAAVVVLAWRAGRVDRRHRALSTAVFDDLTRSASEHRSRAEAAAARGDWNVAILERFRALVRALEERGTLDPRPGRTADEVTRDAAAHFPTHADELMRAARTFDDVAYGDKEGSALGFRQVARADDQLRSSSPVVAR
jgi:hypothetical protein